MSPSKTRINIMLDNDLLAHYRRLAGEVNKGYQTLINETLRAAAGLPISVAGTRVGVGPGATASGAANAVQSSPHDAGEAANPQSVFAALCAQQQEIEKLANQQQELFAMMQGMFFPDNLAGAANMVSLGIDQLRHLSEGAGALADAHVQPASKD
jgi:hypothetical protein